MDWFSNWLRDVVYMFTGVAFVFIVAVAYALFRLLLEWMEDRPTPQPKQPQKVEGTVKQPMGFL